LRVTHGAFLALTLLGTVWAVSTRAAFTRIAT
jgi:hypothetical protein